MSVEAGLKAFKGGRFAEAIELLHPYCQECEAAGTTGSTAYMQAKMGLIKSYQGSKQFDEARALCEQLIAGNNPALTAWANKLVPALNSPPPTPAAESPNPQANPSGQDASATSENPKLLEDGLKLMKKGQYAEAVPLLEEYLQGCASILSRNYLQAQMGLIKSYQNSDQKEKAIALCKSLINTENTALRSWIAQNISKLVPPEELEPVPAQPDGHSAPEAAPPSTSEAAAAPAPPSMPPTTSPESRPATSYSTSPTRTTPTRTTPTRTTPTRTTSSSKASSQPSTPMPSHSIVHSATSFMGKIFLGLVVRMLIRRGIGLVFVVLFWFLRGYWRSAPQANVPVGEVTPLHQAAGQGNIGEVQRLLGTGADANARDPLGRTPLFWAVSGCVFQFNEDYETTHCTTPANLNHEQVVQSLLAQGADGTVQDVSGETPLHWAAAHGTHITAKPLLDSGVDVNIKDAYGFTPLAIAQDQENQVMVQFLQGRGATE